MGRLPCVPPSADLFLLHYLSVVGGHWQMATDFSINVDYLYVLLKELASNS